MRRQLSGGNLNGTPGRKTQTTANGRKTHGTTPNGNPNRKTTSGSQALATGSRAVAIGNRMMSSGAPTGRAALRTLFAFDLPATHNCIFVSTLIVANTSILLCFFRIRRGVTATATAGVPNGEQAKLTGRTISSNSKHLKFIRRCFCLCLRQLAIPLCINVHAA